MKKKRRNKFTVYSWQLTKYLSIAFCQLSIVMLIACASGEEYSAVDEYTCPMHPTVISDRPGACPVCGMELVRKAPAGDALEITPELAQLLKAPSEKVVGSIETIRGEYSRRETEAALQGIVTFDTRRVRVVSARVSGRLETVFANYAFQWISKGSELAEVYSPELAAAQREYLYLRQNNSDQRLLAASRTRLELLGMDSVQLKALDESGSAVHNFKLYSPYSGFLISLTESAPVARKVPDVPGMGGGMGEAPSANLPVPVGGDSGSELIREGSYINRGEVIFRIVDPTALWLELLVPSGVHLSKGDAVEVQLADGSSRDERVELVQPFFPDGEPFQRVRVSMTRTSVRPGQWLEARMSRGVVDGLWIPQTSVLSLGERNVVFLKKGSAFTPVEVKLGASSEGWIEVRSGLTSGDEFARDAHYLVDSESFVKVKVE